MQSKGEKRMPSLLSSFIINQLQPQGSKSLPRIGNDSWLMIYDE